MSIAEREGVIGMARPSMFGLRWINATSVCWHARADCTVLRTARTRSGWRPFPISLGHGRDFYRPCRLCTTPAPGARSPKAPS